MSLFGSVIGIAAPLIGAYLGGPVGAAAGKVVASKFAPRPAALIGGPAPGYPGAVRTATPMKPPLRSIAPAGARAGLAAGRSIDAMGVVRSVTGKLLGVMKGVGTMVSRKKIVRLAKTVGIEVAAATLGVTALIVAQMVMDDQASPKRQRGISASDVKCTRRTVGKIRTITRSLVDSGICKPRAPSRKC